MTQFTHLDKGKIKQSFGAAASSYDQLAGLQRQVGRDLLSLFPPVETDGWVMDLGCGTGFLTRQLLKINQQQSLLAVDIALPMLTAARQKNSLDSQIAYLCADAENLALTAGSMQQIYSNLALQWCENLPAVFRRCRCLLQSDGQLVFATFGPKTLQELKAAWAQVDSYDHVNQFYTQADVVGFLAEAGFTDVRAESRMYQHQYRTVLELMHELKGIGAHNVSLGRKRKPTTRSQLQQMMESYRQTMLDDKVLASYEIILVRAR